MTFQHSMERLAGVNGEAKVRPFRNDDGVLCLEVSYVPMIGESETFSLIDGKIEEARGPTPDGTPEASEEPATPEPLQTSQSPAGADPGLLIPASIIEPAPPVAENVPATPPQSPGSQSGSG